MWGAGADYSRWRNPPNDSAANHELNYLNWQTMQNIYDEKNSDFVVLVIIIFAYFYYVLTLHCVGEDR